MSLSVRKKCDRNIAKRRVPRVAFHATLLLLAVGFVFSGLKVHAAETAVNLEQKTQEFMKKYPEADANKDGALTPVEIWYSRSKMQNAGNYAAMKDMDALMEAGYTPTPIDENKTYGPAPGKKIKLFILSGQSNMVGQGLSAELSEGMLHPNNQLLMFENGKWQPLRPLRPTFGPEITFGHAMANAWPDETIGIVKQAQGGTAILAWHPNWTREKADRAGDEAIKKILANADANGDGKISRDEASGRISYLFDRLDSNGDRFLTVQELQRVLRNKGVLWKELTDKVRDARNKANCEIMGFIWQQGGADMQKLETGKQYLSNLRALIEGLRKETGVPDLPLVLGSYRPEGIPDDLSNFNPEQYTGGKGSGRGGPYVLKAQFDAQKELAPAKMVPLRDLEKHPENVHYNTNGQLELGRLFAQAYLELAGR